MKKDPVTAINPWIEVEGVRDAAVLAGGIVGDYDGLI